MGLKLSVMSYATCSGNAGAPGRGSGRKRRRCISVATISVTDICARGGAYVRSADVSCWFLAAQNDQANVTVGGLEPL